MLTKKVIVTVTVYDFKKQNRKKIEEILASLEYIRFFNHIVCINMACFATYGQKILAELEFFERKETLFIFYEKLEAREEYDGDRQVKFLKENGFYCTFNCLCVGVTEKQTIEDSMEDSLKKANFIS